MHTFVRYATLQGGNCELNVESLIMILSSLSLAYFSPPYIVTLTRLLWSSLTETCNNCYGTSCDSVWPSISTFRKSLKNGDCATCGWCIIQLYRDLFIFSSIFEFHFCFCFYAHGVFSNLIALHLYLEALTQQ